MRPISSLRSAAPALAGLALLAGGVAQVVPAHADMWCFDDPVYTVNGQQATIVVGVNADAATMATAGVVANVVVYVPAGAPTSIITSPSITPFLETFSFVTQGTWNGNGAVPVKVVVSFTSTQQLPTSMNVTYPSGKTKTVSGTTNGTLSTNYSS